MSTSAHEQSPWRPELARSLGEGVPGLLRDWNDQGGLAAADVHVAQRLGALGGEDDPEVLLACALAVRAVREGSVCLDLGDVAAMVPVPADADADADADLGADAGGAPPLTVPAPGPWEAKVRASPLVGEGRPWVWSSDRLYLHRYLTEEQQVAGDLLAREREPADVDEQRLAAALTEVYGDDDDAYADQRAAVETACRHRTSVVTGGPGAGKTTTLARLIAVLLRMHEGEGSSPLRIHLAAPTGKAAARMAQSVRGVAEDPGFPAPDLADRLADLPATTVHRLLGFRPGHGNRFAHDRHHRLPADVVVIDEASMLSLTMTARLLEAMRPDARLVLVGDADQLASVDAGAVLGDLVEGLAARPDPPVARLGGSRRFGTEIGRLAAAVREGRVEDVLEQLHEGQGVQDGSGGSGDSGDSGTDRQVVWVPHDGAPGHRGGDHLASLLLGHAERLHRAGEGGDAPRVLEELAGFRALCAHREGPYGAGSWNRDTSRRLGDLLGTHLPAWYPGRPLLVEGNDAGLGLFNGDSAVVLRGGAGLVGVVDDGSAQGRVLGTTRLAETSTAYAMTVHRSQGSQFSHVAVLLPDPTSRVLTRELLYTALTRASDRVTLVGTEAALRAAVERQARRATRLAMRLGT